MIFKTFFDFFNLVVALKVFRWNIDGYLITWTYYVIIFNMEIKHFVQKKLCNSERLYLLWERTATVSLFIFLSGMHVSCGFLKDILLIVSPSFSFESVFSFHLAMFNIRMSGWPRRGPIYRSHVILLVLLSWLNYTCFFLAISLAIIYIWAWSTVMTGRTPRFLRLCPYELRVDSWPSRIHVRFHNI